MASALVRPSDVIYMVVVWWARPVRPVRGSGGVVKAARTRHELTRAMFASSLGTVARSHTHVFRDHTFLSVTLKPLETA